jgi:hypothetical protein
MRDRKHEVQFQIDRLERRHGELSMRVAELDRQSFLNARDQMLVRSLKKEKLAAKDALFGLRRTSD